MQNNTCSSYLNIISSFEVSFYHKLEYTIKSPVNKRKRKKALDLKSGVWVYLSHSIYDHGYRMLLKTEFLGKRVIQRVYCLLEDFYNSRNNAVILMTSVIAIFHGFV